MGSEPSGPGRRAHGVRLHRLPWRIAFISDPHGDFVALSRVMSDLERVGPVDEVLVGGDLAQGGAQPAEVVDEIRQRGWSSVRGNGDDLLVRIADSSSADALREAQTTHDDLPRSLVARAKWSVNRLGPERIEYLRSLPLSIVRGPFAFGTVMLVHATPWSTQDVVLPDAEDELAERVVREAGARLVVYGHIHTPYQRRVGDSVLMSVGAISGSNDADSRPAYTVVNLAATISVEVHRVEWPLKDRLATYKLAGIGRRFSRDKPGPLPLRSEPGVAVTVWP
jgi:predicted phosphodiesterase